MRRLRLEALEDRRLLSGDASVAINQFAFDLYEHMQKEEGNLFFSPLSISTALAMAYAGAAGQTAAEMEQVLHFGDSKDIHAAFADLLASFAERTGEDPPPVSEYAEFPDWEFDGPPPSWWPQWPDRPASEIDPSVFRFGGAPRPDMWPQEPLVEKPVWPFYASLPYWWPHSSEPAFDFQLDVANGVWPDDDMVLSEYYVDLLASQYDAYIQAVDYSAPAAAEQTINDWVSQRTREQIQDLVKGTGPATVLVLTNTAYFNAAWDSPFDPSYTTVGQFHKSDGTSVDAGLMYNEVFAYVTMVDGFKVIDLEMGGGQASMIVAMPVDEVGPKELTQSSLEAIGEWLNSERADSFCELGLTLPRFSIDVTTSLNEVLKDMGMPTAFDAGAAEFPPIGGFIQDVFHKTALEVTEQGTTAAAATKVEFGICFAAGTMVLTPDGSRRIEDIRVGDRVLARNEHRLEGEVEPKIVEATRHGEAEIVELHLGQRRIRTTALHPFFVEGVGWLAAAQIKAGDRLACDRGGSIVVSHVEATGRIEAVFNLSVVAHRTYFVGEDDWGFGVWAHNSYSGVEFTVDRPFHLIIRDNLTDTIAFMGRIDDPTQLENSVTPQVVVSNASWGDFDNSGVVDQQDYTAWRAAFGQTGVDLPADGNGDGVVDSADYTVWRDNLGSVLPAAEAIESSEPGSPPAEENRAPLFTPAVRPGKSLSRPAAAFQTATPQSVEPDLLLLLANSHARPARSLPVAEPLSASHDTEPETPAGEAFALWADSMNEWSEFGR